MSKSKKSTHFHGVPKEELEMLALTLLPDLREYFAQMQSQENQVNEEYPESGGT